MPSECTVILGQEVYTCPTVRRFAGEYAYTQECIQPMQASFYEYIKKGASTTKVVTYKGTLKTSGAPTTIDNPMRPTTCEDWSGIC